MNLTLSDVENILRSELKRYRNTDLHRERWEDGIQEGLIRAWKDMESGETDRWKIVNRAKLWAKVYILNSDGKRYMTGHIPGSKYHTNPNIKPMLTKDGHIDHHAYRYHSVDDKSWLADPTSSSADGVHPTLQSPSFEDELLSELSFLEMISALGEDDKKALYLHHVVGNTHQEIAEALGVKFSNAATRRLKRAHKALEGTL